MGDILEFPSQQTQGLAFLDRQLRELLAAKGADDQLVDFAARQLTKMYAQLSESEQYSFTVELPAHLGAQEKAQPLPPDQRGTGRDSQGKSRAAGQDDGATGTGARSGYFNTSGLNSAQPLQVNRLVS